MAYYDYGSIYDDPEGLTLYDDDTAYPLRQPQTEGEYTLDISSLK